MPYSKLAPEEGSPNQAAKVYIDGKLLPVAPSSWSVKINGQNESGQLTDGKPYTFLKRPKARSHTMEYIHPTSYDASFMNVDTHIMEYVAMYQKLQDERTPFVFSIFYADKSAKGLRMVLDSFDYVQEAENGSDWTFTLEMTEYHPIENIELRSDQRAMIPQGARDSARLFV